MITAARCGEGITSDEGCVARGFRPVSRGIPSGFPRDSLRFHTDSATRRASVSPVSTGLAEPDVGNRDWSQAYALPM